MVAYFRSLNRELPVPEHEDEAEALQPEVEVVWNHYEKGGAKTIAVKVSVRLPLHYKGVPAASEAIT